MDEKFKRKLLAVPKEVFENWEWRNGDQFLYKELGADDFYIHGYIGDHALCSNSVLHINVIGDGLEGEIIPVLTPERIQDMLATKNKWKSEGGSPTAVMRGLHKHLDIAFELNPNYEIESWEMFWLDYFMGDQYFLTWIEAKGKWS